VLLVLWIKPFLDVDGVWASSDPSYPGATLSAIDTWDPWLNHANHSLDGTHPYNQTENQVWSLTDWTTDRVMWGQGYNTHNGSDPDPDTSNHYYVPPFNSYGVPAVPLEYILRHHRAGSYQ